MVRQSVIPGALSRKVTFGDKGEVSMAWQSVISGDFSKKVTFGGQGGHIAGTRGGCLMGFKGGYGGGDIQPRGQQINLLFAHPHTSLPPGCYCPGTDKRLISQFPRYPRFPNNPPKIEIL